jgi:hypothetical protein
VLYHLSYSGGVGFLRFLRDLWESKMFAEKGSATFLVYIQTRLIPHFDRKAEKGVLIGWGL